MRYQHITWPADTSLGFKKFEIFFAKFVGFHRSISVANRKDASRLGPLNAASYQPPANERIEKESLNGQSTSKVKDAFRARLTKPERRPR